MSDINVLEICAGAGGQALGFEQAGFHTVAAVEIDRDACSTLRTNRPAWNVLHTDLREFSAKEFSGVDVLAGGVPCPPFSVAGKQLGPADDRDLFPDALRLVKECDPRAVMLENVRGLASSRFEPYRKRIIQDLGGMGYEVFWRLILSADYSVPQLRPRFVLVALKRNLAGAFSFPSSSDRRVSVGETLFDLMAENGWKGAENWRSKANDVAPTLVGGSKKHGGADLGPTRAKRQWELLGVDGKGIADAPPNTSHSLDYLPRLTIRMAARIQGFPDDWKFMGGKTSQYRQIGNAFPAPVAKALGVSIARALRGEAALCVSDPELPLNFAAE